MTRIAINNLFNRSFYGSVLWDRLEKTWNVSIRKLADLPRKIHRFFIEPVSQTKHIIFSLYGRFINFINSIKRSKKSAMKNLLHVVQNDCRSRTSSNLRKILLKTTKGSVLDLEARDFKQAYQRIPNGCDWKLQFLKECIDCRSGNLVLPGFHRKEVEDILTYICTS